MCLREYSFRTSAKRSEDHEIVLEKDIKRPTNPLFQLSTDELKTAK